jgi:hypothetical protein
MDVQCNALQGSVLHRLLSFFVVSDAPEHLYVSSTAYHIHTYVCTLCYFYLFALCWWVYAADAMQTFSGVDEFLRWSTRMFALPGTCRSLQPLWGTFSGSLQKIQLWLGDEVLLFLVLLSLVVTMLASTHITRHTQCQPFSGLQLELAAVTSCLQGLVCVGALQVEHILSRRVACGTSLRVLAVLSVGYLVWQLCQCACWQTLTL